MDKFRLLEASDIEVKVKQVKKNGAVLLLYKTARTDMDILDETVGSENWTNDYREIKGNLYCGIAIREGDAWTWKWDCGIESREDGEGNEKRGGKRRIQTCWFPMGHWQRALYRPVYLGTL